MKISAFVPLGNKGNTPDEWQYAWRESIESWLALADEVVVVCGSLETQTLVKTFFEDRVITTLLDWEYDFSWETIAQHFNKGLETCTGDWIIKFDIDYILHERYISEFRDLLMLAAVNKFELASYMKTTVLNKDEYYLKLAVPFCIAGEAKEKYKFGVPIDDENSAWGYPIEVCGWDDIKGLPIGKSIPDLDNIALRSGIEVYNYDNTFRDKETTGKHFLRFSDARERAGFKREWGTTTEGALRKFQDMMAGRMKKTNGGIRKKFKEHGGHPKYIKDRIKKLTEDKFGYNQWK